MESNPHPLRSLTTIVLLLSRVIADVMTTNVSLSLHWNSSQLMTRVTLSEKEIKEYEEKEYLRAKCRFYQGFRIKDRDAFQAWIYKQWGQDQFDLEDDFRNSNYDNLYLKLLERFNYTQRMIYNGCRNIYYPEYNDTRERTHREKFRGNQ
ncbi:uncharacterized protein LOC103515832 [Diaphorina citri]|uniref:Uncharacterized protein LOC103515832 n=1 Tax=Diaphorina citri TaxID=121845 RepID=A0A1S3DC69_DIACI|nr:uncharacterized protein LOC103515832 [Diaphorina citri]